MRTGDRVTDIDVVVPKERFQECRQLLRDNGYDVSAYWSHSIDVGDQGEPCADLHWCVFKGNAREVGQTDLVVARGSHVTKQGVTFAIPSAEDTFLNILTNAASNFILAQNSKGSVTWLADCIDLSERYELSYSTIAEHAREYGVMPELRIALALVGYFQPNAFPESTSQRLRAALGRACPSTSWSIPSSATWTSRRLFPRARSGRS